MVKEKIKNNIEKLSVTYSKIELFTSVNQSVKIICEDAAEVLFAIINDTICGGTGGGGWDNLDGGEVKNSSYVQSRQCKNCETKITFFKDTCPTCGSKFKDLKSPKDARWGIGAKSHFDNYDELKEYRLCLTEPVKDHPSCREFRVRFWNIAKDSSHLNKYATGQYESPKSNHINFQPLKNDFYLSRPVLIIDGILKINENDINTFDYNFFDLNNQTPEEIPEEYIPEEYKKEYRLTGEVPERLSEEVIQKKKFGKDRGKTSRQSLSKISSEQKNLSGFLV